MTLGMDQGTGFWLLASGYWLLATGYWLLATSRTRHIPRPAAEQSGT